MYSLLSLYLQETVYRDGGRRKTAEREERSSSVSKTNLAVCLVRPSARNRVGSKSSSTPCGDAMQRTADSSIGVCGAQEEVRGRGGAAAGHSCGSSPRKFHQDSSSELVGCGAVVVPKSRERPSANKRCALKASNPYFSRSTSLTRFHIDINFRSSSEDETCGYFRLMALRCSNSHVAYAVHNTHPKPRTGIPRKSISQQAQRETQENEHETLMG